MILEMSDRLGSQAAEPIFVLLVRRFYETPVISSTVAPSAS